MPKPKEQRKSKQGPQDLTVRMMMSIDTLERGYADLAQRIQAMSPIVQQMIVTMVLLNEKGVISDGEIAEKQRELMQPIKPGFHDLSDKIERGSGDAGQGSSETRKGPNKDSRKDDTTGTDGDTDPGVSESGKLQSKNTGTIKGDSERSKLRLSPNPSEGSNQSGSGSQSDRKPDGSRNVSAGTDSGIKATDSGKD